MGAQHWADCLSAKLSTAAYGVPLPIQLAISEISSNLRTVYPQNNYDTQTITVFCTPILINATATAANFALLMVRPMFRATSLHYIQLWNSISQLNSDEIDAQHCAGCLSAKLSTAAYEVPLPIQLAISEIPCNVHTVYPRNNYDTQTITVFCTPILITATAMAANFALLTVRSIFRATTVPCIQFCNSFSQLKSDEIDAQHYADCLFSKVEHCSLWSSPFYKISNQRDPQQCAHYLSAI